MQVPPRQTSVLTTNGRATQSPPKRLPLSQRRSWNRWRNRLVVLLLFSVAVVGVRAALKTAPLEEAATAQATPVAQPAKFPVHIRKPAGPPTVDTGILDAHGATVMVSCSTCHTTRQPNHQNKTVKQMNEFHQGMAFAHGKVSCLSCHNPNDYDSLKLADGSRVEFTEVMTLCAQCHGPQMKDYQHGVHGGMTGHWDLTKGPQTKNNCVDCHNPHSPQFPKMQPTFKPKDRFLEPAGAQH